MGMHFARTPIERSSECRTCLSAFSRMIGHGRVPDWAPQTGAALRCEDHKMATTYPYISSSGPVVKTVERFRKQFPGEVTAETLRKLGIAPKNESYVINILKFLNLIDENGKKVDVNARAFFRMTLPLPQSLERS